MSGETESSVSGWTVDTLHELMLTRTVDQQKMLDERYATQTKALDAAFKAAEQAVAVALSNAEKAVAKAEAAANTRFESVNEFRQALTDQTATFLPRPEYETAHQALATLLTATNERLSALELRLTSRLDTSSGRETGASESKTEHRLDMGQVMALSVIVIQVIGTVILIILHFH